MRRPFFLVLASACLLLTACQRTPATDAPPLGPFNGTGTLLPTEVSLIHRGTHLLKLLSGQSIYVESKTQNLAEFEGKSVYAEGTLEANTKKTDLPVLALTSLRSLRGGVGSHTWEIPALNLRMTTPDDWQGTIQKNVATFLLPQESTPILRVRILSGSTLPPGSAFYIQNRRATRSDTAPASIQEVYILEKGSVLEFTFDPTTQASIQSADEAAVRSAEFDRILADLAFLSDEQPSSVPTGSGAGLPCGGIAGILCPGGSYCDISDPTTQVGRCKAR